MLVGLLALARGSIICFLGENASISRWIAKGPKKMGNREQRV